MKLIYRPEIDGLRGLSILLVILFHAKVPFFSSGFLGVDIFFVISGYLITSIILNEIKLKRFSLINFYERRARRILPALYFLLFLLCIYSFFYQAPYFSKDLSQSIFSTVTFIQNFLNIIEAADYFSLDYDYKSLGHTWSLSIEEQFYFFFPLFLILLFKYNFKKYLTNSILIFLIISIFIYFLFRDYNQNLTFYLTFTRIWEILFGALVACISFKKRLDIKNYNFFGLAIIILALFIGSIFDQQNFARLLAVIGTCLVIFNNGTKPKSKFLSFLLTNKFLVFIGLISYSLYLWHVPIFSIFRAHNVYTLTQRDILILTSLSIIVSFSSYKYIEKPFRKKRNFSKKQIFMFTFCGIFMFAIFGILGHFTNGFEKFKITSIEDERKKYYISFDTERKKLKNFKISNNSSKEFKILLIGDSVAGDISTALKLNNVYSERFTLNGPCFYQLVKNKYACNKKIENVLKEAKLYDLTIISSDFINEDSENGAIELLRYLKQNNIKTKIIGSLNFQFVSTVSFQYAKSDSKIPFEKYIYKKLNPKVLSSNNIFLKNIPGDFINKHQLFCNNKLYTCDIFDQNHKPLIFDTKHFTINGYKILGEKIISKLKI